MTPQQSTALIDLGRLLKSLNYQFTAVTPATHKRVLGRVENATDYPLKSLRDFLGWNLWVSSGQIPEEILYLLEVAQALEKTDGKVKAGLRASTIEGCLFLHSRYPTQEKDSIFFGPDSYRFVRFINSKVKAGDRLLDLGAGSGVGGICASVQLQARGEKLERLVLSDVNSRALALAAVNASINEQAQLETISSDLFSAVPEGLNVIIANPPFIKDDHNRTYRDGGDYFGSELSLKIVKDFLSYASQAKGPTRLLLYTGASVVDGKDVFHEQLNKLIGRSANDPKWSYEELDPDIFGEELAQPAYSRVERIAAVGLELSL